MRNYSPRISIGWADVRVCIFTTDLGTVARRRETLLPRIAEMTGERTFEEVCFVGCHQSQPLEHGMAAFQPYVDTDNYSKMRIANTLFRLVDAKSGSSGRGTGWPGALCARTDGGDSRVRS